MPLPPPPLGATTFGGRLSEAPFVKSWIRRRFPLLIWQRDKSYFFWPSVESFCQMVGNIDFIFKRQKDTLWHNDAKDRKRKCCSFLTWFGHEFPAGQIVSVRSFLIAATTRYSGFFLLSLVTRFACDIGQLHGKDLDLSFIWGHHHLHI